MATSRKINLGRFFFWWKMKNFLVSFHAIISSECQKLWVLTSDWTTMKPSILFIFFSLSSLSSLLSFSFLIFSFSSSLSILFFVLFFLFPFFLSSFFIYFIILLSFSMPIFSPSLKSMLLSYSLFLNSNFKRFISASVNLPVSFILILFAFSFNTCLFVFFHIFFQSFLFLVLWWFSWLFLSFFPFLLSLSQHHSHYSHYLSFFLYPLSFTHNMDIGKKIILPQKSLGPSVKSRAPNLYLTGMPIKLIILLVFVGICAQSISC